MNNVLVFTNQGKGVFFDFLADLEKDTDIVEITDGYQAQNLTIQGEKLIKTSTGTFLIVESTVDNALFGFTTNIACGLK